MCIRDSDGAAPVAHGDPRDWGCAIATGAGRELDSRRSGMHERVVHQRQHRTLDQFPVATYRRFREVAEGYLALLCRRQLARPRHDTMREIIQIEELAPVDIFR